MTSSDFECEKLNKFFPHFSIELKNFKRSHVTFDIILPTNLQICRHISAINLFSPLINQLQKSPYSNRQPLSNRLNHKLAFLKSFFYVKTSSKALRSQRVVRIGIIHLVSFLNQLNLENSHFLDA